MNRNRNSKKIVPLLALAALLLLSSACGTPTPTASPSPTATALPPVEPQGYGDHFSFEIPEGWRLVDREGDASGSFSPEESAILAVNEELPQEDGVVVYVRGNVPPELFQYAAEMGLNLNWKGTRYQINDPATGQSTFPFLIEEVTLQ